jgi:hypothetical protein
MQQMEASLTTAAPSENPPFTDWRGNMIRLLQGRDPAEVTLPIAAAISTKNLRQNYSQNRMLADIQF